MKKYTRTLVSCILCTVLWMNSSAVLTAEENTSVVSGDAVSEGEASGVSSALQDAGGMLTDGTETAKLTLTNPVQAVNMEFEDGLGDASTTTDSPLYSEITSLDSIECRKFYKGNDLVMRLDQDFYDETDREFLLMIKYWDFGDGAGTIYIDYTAEQEEVKRISIQKPGTEATWRTKRIYLADADFGGKLEYKGDIKIITMGYNAFAEIMVVNIGRARKNANFARPNVSEDSVNTLTRLGLYTGQPGTSLSKTVTAQEALRQLLTACGYIDGTAGTEEVLLTAQVQGLIHTETDPQRVITLVELLDYSFALLDSGGGDDPVVAALEAGLLKNEDVCFNEGAALTQDMLAVIAYNILMLKRSGEKYSFLSMLIQSGKIKAEDIEKTGDVQLLNLLYEAPVVVEPERIKDPASGLMINFLNINGGMTILPYLTQQHWTGDGKSFIAASSVTGAIYLYNTETYELQYLDTVYINSMADAVLTPQDIMYYNKNNREVWRMDLNTLEKKKIAEFPDYVDIKNNVMTLQVTDDGKYLSCYWKENQDSADFLGGVNRMRFIVRLNCETGEWETRLITKEFNDILAPEAGHPIINPIDKDIVSFCHESAGKASIKDRIWLGNYRTGETFNLWKEAIRLDGMSGEMLSHEIWSADGEYIYACKNFQKETTLGEHGLVRIKKDGIEREYISSDYMFIHATPDASMNWIVGDEVPTNGRNAAVILVDARTYQSTLLTSFQESSASHPYHPHPYINRQGTLVSFQRRNTAGVLAAAWIDVSSITQNPLEGGREEIAKDTTMVWYEGAENHVQKMVYNGVECYKTGSKAAMYLDFSDKEDYGLSGSLRVSFSYLDIGWQSLKIWYTEEVDNANDYYKRENMEIEIPRRNSGKWVNYETVIDGINLANACKFRTDIKIGGTKSAAYLKDVQLSAVQ